MPSARATTANADTVRAAHPTQSAPRTAAADPQHSDDHTAAPANAAWTACTHIVIDLDDTQTVYLPADAGSASDLLALYNIAKS